MSSGPRRCRPELRHGRRPRGTEEPRRPAPRRRPRWGARPPKTQPDRRQDLLPCRRAPPRILRRRGRSSVRHASMRRELRRASTAADPGGEALSRARQW
jgi:hypothetical protein